MALLLAATAWPASAGAAEGQQQPVQADATIRSQTQLDEYLRRHAATGEPTPLDAFSAGARERFLSDLVWGSKGLGGFNQGDLAEELDDDQIHAVLGLFGSDVAAYAPRSRAAVIGINRTGLTGISDLERRYTRFYLDANRASAHGNDAARNDTVAARFDALFPEARQPATLHALADHDLRLLWRAASQAAGSAPRPDLAETALSVFEVTERRGIIDRQDVLKLRGILLAGRRFEQARRFTAAHPEAGLTTLPAFDDPLTNKAPAATVWRMNADGSRLTRTAIDLEPAQVLVTAGCHFSADAAEDITADPVLGPVFARHAHWLVSTPGVESIDAVRDWNRRFPEAPAEMIHDRGEWSVLPTWSMPEFHVVRGGKVIETVKGWPRSPASNRRPLIDALHRAGLLDQPSAEPTPL
ncbi:hypothetical protein [Luteimonas lutimaris]|uniref:hypothetical protein n=1 Tax=Luteimonas lutimaris TaxID=698645 RepID=UPI002D276A07|nr:hypothetical protein [Luteimonas sp.]